MNKAKHKNAFSGNTRLTLNKNSSLTYDQYPRTNVLRYHNHSHMKSSNDAMLLYTFHSLWVPSRVLPKPVHPKPVLLFGKLTEKTCKQIKKIPNKPLN